MIFRLFFLFYKIKYLILHNFFVSNRPSLKKKKYFLNKMISTLLSFKSASINWKLRRTFLRKEKNIFKILNNITGSRPFSIAKHISTAAFMHQQRSCNKLQSKKKKNKMEMKNKNRNNGFAGEKTLKTCCNLKEGLKAC